MTVCVAALFQWNYSREAGAPNPGAAAIVLTDRMITFGDVQYEPPQTKVAHITPQILLVIAGDYSTHSQAIKKTSVHFKERLDSSPEDVAVFYGRTVQALRLKEAEDLYLAPLGLNSDTFMAQQKEMSSQFVSTIADQMQNYRGEEAEALIVGSHNNYMDIYGVDTKGIVSLHNDVGFASIGSGAWHAKSVLMQTGYANHNTFSHALCVTFAAKKRAEIAPGVGHNTDITLVFRDRIEVLRHDVARKVHDLYLEYKPKSDALGEQFIADLQDYISKPVLNAANEEPKGLPGGDAQTNERVVMPAAETDRTGDNGAAG